MKVGTKWKVKLKIIICILARDLHFLVDFLQSAFELVNAIYQVKARLNLIERNKNQTGRSQLQKVTKTNHNV